MARDILSKTRGTLTHEEQFTLFLRAQELCEMCADLSRPATERVAMAKDFFRARRTLRAHGLDFWAGGRR